MDVSNHLTEEELQEILMRVYEKGNERDIKIIDLVNEIKYSILTKCTANYLSNPK